MSILLTGLLAPLDNSQRKQAIVVMGNNAMVNAPRQSTVKAVRTKYSFRSRHLGLFLMYRCVGGWSCILFIILKRVYLCPSLIA